MISAEDMFEHSSTLYSQPNKSEIILRNVARNSYYALFHKLNDVGELTKISASERSFGAHELLIQQLRMSENPNVRKWGLELSKLKSVRTKADYKLTVRFTDFEARKALKTTEKILSSMDEVDAEANGQAVNTVTEKVKDSSKARPTLTVIK
ncbi:hypothetical protein HJ014_22545 [Vibrio parahaemolyticus]|uniref:hypothetical protein n=1 Tax=Vibrio TaxID=662 RepID=UPI00186A47DB|nr:MULTISPECIES: hypothetical protein [Vibrio]MBE4467408.1 hypothetical protein [Vibrio parahaemolyticus]MCG9638326.1 hypothetical protein [Vibrio parahaemolyticus]MDE1333986.1 hypothetical protein [Vibrio aestuarianus]HCE4695048.1 hypothetical protein [Vibrio parahaemolyticus]